MPCARRKRSSARSGRRAPSASPCPRIGDGQVIYRSAAATELLGTARGSFSHFARREERADVITALLPDGRVDAMRVTGLRADGREFPARLSARVIDYGGEDVIVSGIEDLTEELALEVELARNRGQLFQAEKMSALGELLAGVLHELNNLTAAANVFLGRELKRNVGGITILDHRAMNERAATLFGEIKSETRPRDVVRSMSGGQRQAVAIARTRLSEPRIVLMDEPTAAISVRQVAEVLNLIRHLRDEGIAVVLISHRMPDVFAVCDRVVVLRRGHKVADKPIADSSPEEVTGLITGAIEMA